MCSLFLFFFKQKTAYEMRISDWSSDVCSSDLVDSENFYGTRKDHDDVKAQMATLIIEHDFSDNVRLSNVARVGETKQDYLLTAFMSTGANIVGNRSEERLGGKEGVSKCRFWWSRSH